MLLEQQNEKRFLLARQEQDALNGRSAQNTCTPSTTLGSSEPSSKALALQRNVSDRGNELFPSPRPSASNAEGLFEDGFVLHDEADVVKQLLARWTVNLAA
jgi:hypothetical protein